MAKNNINKNNSLLLVIDVQEKFRPVIFKWKNLIGNITKLIISFQVLKIPILLTEQYPKGLGKTVSEINNIMIQLNPIEKREFNCFNNKTFIKELKKSKKKNLIICGIESHVCVLQTVLSALAAGFNVHLVADAVSSRKQPDYDIAIKRMVHEGAKLVSAEMVIFQLTKTSSSKEFKKIIKIVK